MTRPRIQLLAAFLVVYVVWGSTFLGIRIAVLANLPPILFAGARFVIASFLLGSLAVARGQRLPSRPRDWLVAAIMGVLMISLGNGLVTWGEQWVASNQTALLVSSSALWIAWFGTLGAKGDALTWRAKVGLGVGFAGVMLMLVPGNGFALDHFQAQLIIVASAVCWAAGAMYGRSATVTAPPLMFTSVQMFVGGLVMTVIGLASGDAAQWTWSWRGIGALAYLIVFGSCLAYATYVWLLRHTTPDRLSTISYVNPAVALLLGWWILDEDMSGTRLLGMIVILIGLVLVAFKPRRPPSKHR